MKVRLVMSIRQNDVNPSSSGFVKKEAFDRASIFYKETHRDRTPIKIASDGGIIFGEYESEWTSEDLSKFWGYLSVDGIELELDL